MVDWRRSGARAAAFLGMGLSLAALVVAGPVRGQNGAGPPLAEPTVLQSVDHLLEATIVLDEGTATIAGQTIDNVWTYHVGENGAPSYPGPTLHVAPGDTIRLRYVNRLEDVPTNLHTHGLHVSPLGNSDNVLLSLPPGTENTYEIKIPADHPEGLNWYHPHRHQFVNEQIYRGLAGLLVIGRPDGGPSELDGLRQHLLAVQFSIITDGTLAVPPGPVVSNAQFTINGQLNPTIEVRPGESEVWNLANITPHATLMLRLRGTGGAPDQPLVVVAQDGNPYTAPEEHAPGKALQLPAGGRTSWLVQGPPAGTYELVMDPYFDGFRLWPARTLATLRSGGTPVPERLIPPHLTPPFNAFEPLQNAPVDIRRVAAFGRRLRPFAPPNFLINGKVFPDNPVFQPRLNRVEEWVLTVDHGEDHPFHLHTNGHQVMSVFDPVNPANNVTTPRPYFQDVVNLPKALVGPDGRVTQSRVVIRLRPRDFLGNHVYHCHRTDHEDLGMMAQINVIPETPIYAVGAGPGAGPVPGPLVRVFNGNTNAPLAAFNAFPRAFRGGVRVAVGDVNHDAIMDVIAGAGPGGPPEVKVFSGADGFRTLLQTVVAFDPAFRGGVNVAAGDMNGDTFDDVIVSRATAGPPEVNVFSGADGAFLGGFRAYDDAFTGGVNVAAGVLHDGGRASIITGPAKGAGELRVFEVDWHGMMAMEACRCNGGGCRCGQRCACASGVKGKGLAFHQVARAFAYDAPFQGGVNVAAGLVEGQNGGFSSILTGPGAGGPAVVKAFVLGGDHAHGIAAQGLEQEPLPLDEETSWLAFPPGVKTGARVASVSTPFAADLLVAPGAGSPPLLKRARYQPRTNTFGQVATFFPFPLNFTGGMSLGGR